MENRSTFINQAARTLLVEDLGLLEYEEAHLYQLQCVEKADDRLLFVEHPEVYTFGRKFKENPPNHLNSIIVERGGEATFHNPGQIVFYPILHLRSEERDLHLILRKLEEVVITTLAHFTVEACRKEGATGVWVDRGEKKIASIGIAVKGWVTYHGVALNYNNSLEGYGAIQPCGFSSGVMTRLTDILGDRCPSREQIKERLLQHFTSLFQRNIIERAMIQ